MGRPFYPDAESPYKMFDTVAEYSPFGVVAHPSPSPSITKGDLKPETSPDDTTKLKQDAAKFSEALDSDTYYGIKDRGLLENPQKVTNMDSPINDGRSPVIPIDDADTPHYNGDEPQGTEVPSDAIPTPAQVIGADGKEMHNEDITNDPKNKAKIDDSNAESVKTEPTEIPNNSHILPLKIVNQKPPPIHINEDSNHLVEKVVQKQSNLISGNDGPSFSVNDVVNSEKEAISFAKQFGDVFPEEKPDDSSNTQNEKTADRPTDRPTDKSLMEPAVEIASPIRQSHIDTRTAAESSKTGDNKNKDPHHHVTIDTDTGEIVDDAISPTSEREKYHSKMEENHLSHTEHYKPPHAKITDPPEPPSVTVNPQLKRKDVSGNIHKNFDKLSHNEPYENFDQNQPSTSRNMKDYRYIPQESNQNDHRPDTRNGPYLHANLVDPNYFVHHEVAKEPDEAAESHKEAIQSSRENKFPSEYQNHGLPIPSNSQKHSQQQERVSHSAPKHDHHENNVENTLPDLSYAHHELYNDITNIHSSPNYINAEQQTHPSVNDYVEQLHSHPKPSRYLEQPHPQDGSNFHANKEQEIVSEEDSHVHSSHEGDEIELNTEKVKTIDDNRDYLTHERSEPNHVNPSEKAEMYMMPETDHTNLVPAPYEHESSQPTIIQNHYHKHVHHHNHIHIHSGQEDRPKNGYRHIKLRDMDTVSHSAEKSMQEDHHNGPRSKNYVHNSQKEREKLRGGYQKENDGSHYSRPDQESSEKTSQNFEKERTKQHTFNSPEQNDQPDGIRSEDGENNSNYYDRMEASSPPQDLEESPRNSNSPNNQFASQRQKTGEVISKSVLNKDDDDSDIASNEFYNLLDGVKKAQKSGFKPTEDSLDHVHETETFDNNNLTNDILDGKNQKRNPKKHKKPAFAMEPKILKQHEVVEPSYMVHEDPRGDGLGTGVIDGPELASPVDLTSSKREPENSTNPVSNLLHEVEPIQVQNHESKAIENPKIKEFLSPKKTESRLTDDGGSGESQLGFHENKGEKEIQKINDAKETGKKENKERIEATENQGQKDESHSKQVNLLMKSKELKEFASKIMKNVTAEGNLTRNAKSNGRIDSKVNRPPDLEKDNNKESNKKENEKNVLKDGQTKENEKDKTAVISEEETNVSKGKSTLLSTIQEHLKNIEMDDLNRIQEEIKELKTKKLFSKAPQNTKAFSRTSAHLDLDVKSEKYKIPEKQQTLPLNNPGHPDDMNGIKPKAKELVVGPKKMPLLNPRPEEDMDEDTVSKKHELVPEKERFENAIAKNEISHANLTGIMYKIHGNETELDLQPFVVASKYKNPPPNSHSIKTVNVNGKTRSFLNTKESSGNSEKSSFQKHSIPGALDIGDTPEDYAFRLNVGKNLKPKIKKSLLAKPINKLVKGKHKHKKSSMLKSTLEYHFKQKFIKDLVKYADKPKIRKRVLSLKRSVDTFG